MRSSRLLVILIVAGAVLAGARPASAQLGGLLKKVPKVPSVPSAPSVPGTEAAPKAKEPAPELTADLVDRMISGMKAERQALEQGARDVRKTMAKRAADASPEAQQEKQMALLQGVAAKDEQYRGCIDDAILKDADYPKYEKLKDRAEDELDDTKSEALSRQAGQLRDAMVKRAEPGCASLKPGDYAAEMKAAGIDTSGRQESEEEMLGKVDRSADEAGAKAAGLEVPVYAQRKETLCMGLVRGQQVNSADRALMDARAAELKSALQSVGCSAEGSVWSRPADLK